MKHLIGKKVAANQGKAGWLTGRLRGYESQRDGTIRVDLEESIPYPERGEKVERWKVLVTEVVALKDYLNGL